MTRSISTIIVLALLGALLGVPAYAEGFTTEIFTAAAVGAAVSAGGPEINKFVNTVTFNKGVPENISTKVVPILSVGEKGYIGAAQVAGPETYVSKVKAVWAYDDNFSNNEFRLRILVPSGSINPLQLSKVQKVGITAVVDISLSGSFKNETLSRSITTTDVIKAGAVAIAISAAASPLNKAINTVTGGASANTKVVPIISVGEKAYIGGVQVSGAQADVTRVKAALQYEAAFSTGRYRVRAAIPISSINPLKTSRIQGVGITAIIDTSIADQERVRERQEYWRTTNTSYRGMDVVLANRFRDDIAAQQRHDQGLHKGWYIGKGNQRKAVSETWYKRYQALPESDRPAFEAWWSSHHDDKPDRLEAAWKEWNAGREKARFEHRSQEHNNDRTDDDRGRNEKGKSHGGGKGKK